MDRSTRAYQGHISASRCIASAIVPTITQWHMLTCSGRRNYRLRTPQAADVIVQSAFEAEPLYKLRELTAFRTIQQRCVQCTLMRSWATVSCSSAATSTPVGPPPTTMKLSSRRRSSGVVCGNAARSKHSEICTMQ